ncbi:MAG TPA: isoamylase early set domain-containing protein [Gemmatimonadaceae bacterium]|nr:isoamylase early set domain-containing protein [Gemmatimonadaceae bacterium]
MHDETDETIVRIAAALRPLPDVDPAEKARVLVAVAAERERSRVAGIRAARRWRRVGALGALAAAGLVAAVWLRGRDVAAPTVAATSATTTAVGSTAPSSGVGARLARDDEGMKLKTVQLVLRAPAARTVSVVGDFNGWDAHANTMTRDPASGLWSHNVALRPGRHVYAFVVDDSVWLRDPRSPEATDEDFGRPGSVLLVGQP